MGTPTSLAYSTPFKYTDRASRARYTAEKYAAILKGRVLDVGCDVKSLALHLPAGASYIGIDVVPTADIVLNLDRQNIPFPDRSFDTVVCTDVLEHLERIHEVFDELCRVSDSRIILSLPNPYRNLLLVAADNRPRFRQYGLPAEIPEDRHRWFFGALEAQRFIAERAAQNRFEVEHMDVDERGLPSCIVGGRDLSQDPNFALGTTWAVLRREAV
ncbi:MAG: class I SAM-dependent methyltransferase [Phycisphaerales bacterium]